MVRRLAFVVLATVAALCSALPVHAQDDAIVGDLASLDGIEASVQRLWTVDILTLAQAASPAAESELPSGLVALEASASRFDSTESAAAAFATLVAQAEADIQPVIADVGDQGDVSSEINSAFGNESFVYLATVPDQQVAVRVIIARADAYILMAFGFGRDAESVQATDELATWLVTEGSESDEPEMFAANGQSTGGLWGFMPASDAPFLDHLAAMEDEILAPAPTGQ